MAQNPSESMAGVESGAQTPSLADVALLDLHPPKDAASRRGKEAGAGSGSKGELPTIALAAAGLTVFDTIIALTYIVVWATRPQMLLAIVHAMAGISLLLGVSPIIVGGIILNKNRETGITMPGTQFAVWAIVAGAVMTFLTMAVPLVAAVQALIGA